MRVGRDLRPVARRPKDLPLCSPRPKRRRSETRTGFHRDTPTNRWLWVSLAGVILLQIAVTHSDPCKRLFDTTTITAANWAVCARVASSVLWIEETRKLIHRTRTTQHKEINP